MYATATVWVPICAVIEAHSVIKVLLAHVSMRTSVDGKIRWSTGNDLCTVELDQLVEICHRPLDVRGT